MPDRPGVLDESIEVVTNRDKTLGEQAAGTPFALVALGYLAILAAFCGLVTVVV
jgi:hypothetical protein